MYMHVADVFKVGTSFN